MSIAPAESAAAVVRPAHEAAPGSLGGSIASIAEGQEGVEDNPSDTYCNPYTAYWGDGTACANGLRAAEWCADFAAWVWRQAGVSFTYGSGSADINAAAKSFYYWAVANGTWHPAGSGYTPQAGDVAVYGTSAAAASHVGIVVSNGSSGPNVVNGDWEIDYPSEFPTAVAYQANESQEAGVSVVGYASPPASPPNGFEAAFQANTGSLWTYASPGGPSDLSQGMAAGTSPSVASVGGGYEIAFQANTGSLITIGAEGSRDWNLGMMPGTSPSITALAGGGYEVAFQANTGALWTVGVGGGSQDNDAWNLGLMPGTSPSIAGLAGGGFEVAFQAAGGGLWTVGAGGGSQDNGAWNLGMAPGTGPAIAGFASGGFEVAFQAAGGSLWTVGAGGGSQDIGAWNLGMMPGTGPSIATVAGGGFQVAFQANTGSLWVVGAGGGSTDNGDLQQGMMFGTTPSIMGLPGGGFEVGFEANTGSLIVLGAAANTNTGLGMMAYTSPGMGGGSQAPSPSRPPGITSAGAATFDAGRTGSFTVTTSGFPTPSLSESGALPRGVSFTDNGNGTATLTGTPASTSVGTYDLVITASNGVAPDATQTLVLTVGMTVHPGSLPAAKVHAKYHAALSVVGGTSPHSWRVISGTLPAGLTLSKAGVISGTPTTAGSAKFTVKVTDSSSPPNSATKTYTLKVKS